MHQNTPASEYYFSGFQFRVFSFLRLVALLNLASSKYPTILFIVVEYTYILFKKNLEIVFYFHNRFILLIKARQVELKNPTSLNK